jgi:hypothetical protein
MNYWFIVHDLKAYTQHSDLIGCRVKRPGLQQPMLKQFAEIKKGDKIVYYASKNCVIVGIFDVVSDITYLEKDPYWNEIMVYSIRPAEMPPESEKWCTHVHRKTRRKLTEHDFPQVIKDNARGIGPPINPDF